MDLESPVDFNPIGSLFFGLTQRFESEAIRCHSGCGMDMFGSRFEVGGKFPL